MSNKYIVDTDAVDKAVKELKALQEECYSYYNKNIPTSQYDMGKTHDEIQLLHENLKNNWRKFDELISKTIEFLGKDSETIITSDKLSAANISGTSKGNISSANSSSSGGSSSGGSGGGSISSW